jgi:hypothetical protein
MARTKIASKPASGDQPRQSSVILTVSAPITHHPTSSKAPKVVTFHNGRKFKVKNDMVAMFFKFVCERHQVHLRRQAGLSPPWTEDVILSSWPFTNVFRVLDRNTQYILQRVIGDEPRAIEDAVFRVMLFRFFNKVETWQLLESTLGEISWRNFSIRTYAAVLEEAKDDGDAIYGPAYIIPAPREFGSANHEAHLRLLDTMMAEGNLPKQLLEYKHIKDAHGYLSLYPGMGPFTAMQ